MTTPIRPSVLSPESSVLAPSGGVWERVWRHRPSDEKDRASLEREARCERWALIVKALVETFGRIEGLRTVELGAGRGDLSLLLALRGARVTLLDRTQIALDQARERFERFDARAEFLQADLLDPPDSLTGHSDVSVSLGVIEHFTGADRLAAVRAHRSVLRPGGLAVISVPNAGCIPYRLWKAYLELRGWWPYGLEIPYSRRELRRLAEAAGFDRWRLRSTAFLWSLGEQWSRTFLRWRPGWTDAPSILDGVMGFNLMLLAWETGRSTED